MKQFLGFLILTLFIGKMSAQGQLLKYTIQPIVDSLTVEMKTQTSFSFSAKGKYGYYEIESGVVVPPQFKSVVKLEVENLEKSKHQDAPIFYKVRYGKYFGLYRLRYHDSLKMLPCVYDDIVCKFIDEKILMIAFKGNRIDTFNGLGASLIKQKKSTGITIVDDEMIHGDLMDMQNSDWGAGYEGPIVDHRSYATYPPRLLANGKYSIVQSRMSPIAFQVMDSKSKKIIITSSFKSINFIEKRGLFACSNDSIYTLFDTLGNVLGKPGETDRSTFVIRNSQVDVYDFYVAKNVKTKMYGIMDRNFNWLIDPIYVAYKVSPHERFVGLFNGNSWRIYDNKTQKTNDINFESYFTNYEHRFGVIKLQGELMLYDSVNKSSKSLNGYKFIQSADTLAILNNGHAYLIIHLKNGKQTIVSAEELSFFSLDKHYHSHRFQATEQLLLIKNEGKLGLINGANKTYVPILYDSVVIVKNKSISDLPYLLLKRNGLYYYHSMASNKMVQDSISQLFFNERELNEIFTNPFNLPARELVFPYVIKRNQYYYRIYDINKRPVHPRKFDTVVYNHPNYWITQSMDGYGMWKLSSNEFEKGFDSVALIKNHDMNFHFMFKKNRCFAYDRVNGKVVQMGAFETFEPKKIEIIHESEFYRKKQVLKKYVETLYVFILKNKNTMGLLFPDGDYTSVIYDEVLGVENAKLVWVKVNGKWGLIRY